MEVADFASRLRVCVATGNIEAAVALMWECRDLKASGLKMMERVWVHCGAPRRSPLQRSASVPIDYCKCVRASTAWHLRVERRNYDRQ